MPHAGLEPTPQGLQNPRSTAKLMEHALSWDRTNDLPLIKRALYH
jgi:hypothetical protein